MKNIQQLYLRKAKNIFVKQKQPLTKAVGVWVYFIIEYPQLWQ